MVSIVIPVYNAEKYIENCIRSILRQTYEEWELVLIDNGSTDGSLEICQKFAKEDERIFVFHQFQNKGVSVARNLGIEKSTGEFLTFIDADDWVKEDYLERLVELQKKYQTSMVICGYEKAYKTICDEDKGAYENQGEDLSKEKALKQGRNSCAPSDLQKFSHRNYTVEEYLEQYLLEGNTHCWGVLYRYDLLEEVKFPIGMSIGEDLLFLIDVALKTEQIVVTDYQGYYYFINESGVMKKKFTLSYMDQITCWQRAYEKIMKVCPGLKDKLESILMVSALLVVGKLSELDKTEQQKYAEQLESCLELVRKYEKNKATYQYLPSGYFVKVKMFSYLPSLYLNLYGAVKR